MLTRPMVVFDVPYVTIPLLPSYEQEKKSKIFSDSAFVFPSREINSSFLFIGSSR